MIKLIYLLYPPLLFLSFIDYHISINTFSLHIWNDQISFQFSTGQLKQELTDAYGDKVVFSNTPLSAEEMGENKAFNVSVDGTEVYNRLNADKTNRTDTDPNPSTDGGKANAGGNWGPIVPKEGNDWWGTATPGKRKWYLHSIPLVQIQIQNTDLLLTSN